MLRIKMMEKMINSIIKINLWFIQNSGAACGARKDPRLRPSD